MTKGESVSSPVRSRAPDTEGLTRASGDDDPLSAVSKIPQIYGPLAKRGTFQLSEKETDELRSGATAWARAVALRIELAEANKPAGSVADENRKLTGEGWPGMDQCVKSPIKMEH